jgi:hypothetical protein
VLLAAFLLLPAAGAGATIIVTGVNGSLGAAGFDGQPGGDGTPGGDASASGDDTDVQAFGGSGGPGGNGGPGVAAGENGGNGGYGGAGGHATATASPSGVASASSNATGGNGGDGGHGASAGPGGFDGVGGNGGAGGGAVAGGSATAAMPFEGLNVRARGGDGGDAFDGGQGGDGGVASLGAITGGPALVGFAIGGNGGSGFGTSGAGVGASTELENAITGGLAVHQEARGGDGGDSESGAAGTGGAARSEIDSSTASSLAAFAIAGDGGDRSGGSELAGDAGSATARASATSSDLELVSSAAAGGDGGDGAGGAGGAPGGDAAASASATSDDDCCGFTALATAVGGGGGDADAAALPGRGGHASAESDAEGTLGFVDQVVQASAQATGGSAGAFSGAGPTGLAGGEGFSDAFAHNHAGDAEASANSRGGDALHGIAGDALATAGAASAGLSFVRADAVGGLGVEPGGRATARARVVSGQEGRAIATASSGTFGSGLSGRTRLHMEVGAPTADGEVEARTVAKLSAPERDLADGLVGAAFGAVIPQQADVDAALAGSTEVAGALAGLEAVALGFVEISGAGTTAPFPPFPHAPNAGLALDIILSEAVSLDEDALVLGLLSSSISDEIGELRFQVRIGTGGPISTVLDEVFTDSAAWLAFFEDRALELGPLGAGAVDQVHLSISLELLGDDPAASVSADFIVGFTAVPEPSTALLMACGLALLAAHTRAGGARRR